MDATIERQSRQTWCGDVSGKTNPINELVKSWVRASWAAALFGASQIVRVLRGNDLSSSTGAVTQAIESELSEEMRMVFQTGDQVQRNVMDAIFSPIAGNIDVPRLTAKMAIDLAQCAANSAAMLAPEGENQVAWLELQNKLETFNLFAHVELALDLPSEGESLPDLVERASRLGPYRSVWATEGVGHFYAESHGISAMRIGLRNGAGALLPSSLVALHSGAGLSFARRCLEGISASEVRAALDQFFGVCDDCSHEQYAGAAYEALGLVTRNLHPHLVGEIDRHLIERDEELVAYFWHGVGRAIYFAPTNFLPDTSAYSRLVKQVQEEPTHELARLNALSGLIWALMLVNIRHPRVLETFLKVNARELNLEVLESALCSAAVVWRDSSLEDQALSALCRHLPSDAGTAGLWNACVSRSCAEVLKHYPVLKNAGLGRLFRHRSLLELGLDPVHSRDD